MTVPYETLFELARTVLPLDGDACDINRLVELRGLSEGDSRAFAEELEAVIAERWRRRDFILSCLPASVDLSAFDRVETVQYEFMPTKVAQGAVEGGLGVLHIAFPAGAEEAERVHSHPGGRIIVPFGPGIFHCDQLEGGRMPIGPGMVVLMPKDTLHNFAATPTETMTVLSFHVGYRDVLGEDAIHWQTT